MSKHFILALAALLLLGACKSKKAVVTAQPGTAELSSKAFKKAFSEKPEAPKWVRIIAEVNITQNGSNNAGVADIRLHQNQQVWVEIADPLVGIKAIRAIALPDSVAYQNRIDRTYFAGPYSWVERKLGTSIPFEYIFNVFMGAPFTTDATVTAIDNKYNLTAPLGDDISFMAEIEPTYLDCIVQELATPKDVIRIFYGNYKEINGYRYPQQMRIEVSGSQTLTATFVVREITPGKALDMPFNLNTKYERIQ
jgi:hypothetical protein